ncbi:MAG: TraR/DksA C4-type zinc finger protein [Pseudomonadota bacterium]
MAVKIQNLSVLKGRRQELIRRVVDAEQEIAAHHNPDWEELAVEREGDEVLETLSETDRQEIRAIDAALERLEKGSYGFCVKCGREIPGARLDVLPATPFCKTCAAAHA